MNCRSERQAKVAQWCMQAFGAAESGSMTHRGLRMMEEAIEAAQSAGCDPNQLHQLIDYVYGRPVGELSQELGGLGVTVLALASTAGLDADDCERVEVERVLSFPLEHFRKRNQVKNEAGFVGSAIGHDGTS